jgi:hypothetical protein
VGLEGASTRGASGAAAREQRRRQPGATRRHASRAGRQGRLTRWAGPFKQCMFLFIQTFFKRIQI